MGMPLHIHKHSLLHERIRTTGVDSKSVQRLPIIVQMLDRWICCSCLQRNLIKQVLKILCGATDFLVEGLVAHLLSQHSCTVCLASCCFCYLCHIIPLLLHPLLMLDHLLCCFNLLCARDVNKCTRSIPMELVQTLVLQQVMCQEASSLGLISKICIDPAVIMGIVDCRIPKAIIF